jgi:hypothetical protein
MGKQSVRPGHSDFMAQDGDQRECNWRAGATANKSREDQQPAGVLGAKARSCAALWYRESLTAATTDWADKRAARKGRRGEGDAGQLGSAITEELTCSDADAGSVRECVLATGVRL